ncbi:MAG: stalk domain-containing protein [Prolixibacteraceae bacterium]
MNRRILIMIMSVMLLVGVFPTSSLTVIAAKKAKETKANLALNKTVYVSQEVDAQNPARAITDGKKRSRWLSTGSQVPRWLYIDLGAPTEFNSVVIVSFITGVAAYQIQVSDDAKSWKEVITRGALPKDVKLNFDKQNARYLRVYITKLTGEGAKSISISDVEIYLNDLIKGEKVPDEEPAFEPKESKNVPASYNPSADIAQLKSGMLFMVGNNTGYVNGQFKRLEQENFMVVPQIAGGEALVPMRIIAYGLGATINWDDGTKTAIISKGDQKISVTIGSDIMKTNNGAIKLNVPVHIINGSIMLPIKGLGKAMGKKVILDKSGMIILCENNAAFGEETDAGRNANHAAQGLIAQTDNNIVTVVPIHPTMKKEYGKPAIIPPGGDYPTIEVTPHYSFSLKTDVVFEDGTIVQSLVSQDLVAEKKLKLKFAGKPVKLGTYQIRLTFGKNGLDHYYSVYFTIVDSSKFTNGIVAEAYLVNNDKLKYVPDFMGNHLIDFSTAGYMGGGVAFPVVDVAKKIKPSGGDDTANIQAAIDAVSDIPLNKEGIRGAVLLGTGVYTISESLSITSSGVVLRGSGSGEGGTLIKFTNKAGIKVAGSGAFKATNTVNAMDLYIPSGSDRIRVQDASTFKVGNIVQVNRTVTAKWIKYVNMDKLIRGGVYQTWLPPGKVHSATRKVKEIIGNTLVLDGSLVDSYDSETLGFPVATVSKGDYSQPRISQIGVEKFRTQVLPAQEQGALTVDNVENSWVNDLYMIDGASSVKLGSQCSKITVNNIEAIHLVGNIEAGPPSDFAINGTNILFSNVRSQVEGAGQWSVVAHEGCTGPLVVINSRNKMSPHMRWTIGILVDNCDWPTDKGTLGLAFINRQTTGSGHGWTTGWSVAWNFTARTFSNQAAKGTANYVIGGGPGTVKGSTPTSEVAENSKIIPQSIYEDFGTKVSPPSLYLQQLKDRIGIDKLPY